MIKVFFFGNTVSKPGDPVLLYGDGLMSVNMAKITQLGNEAVVRPEFVAFATPVSMPTENQSKSSAAPVTAHDGIELSLLQQSDKSIKFFIPRQLGTGVYSVTLYGENEAVTVYLNAPSVQWAQGDEGSACTQGGWLRLIGEKLSLDGKAPSVWLETQGEYIKLPCIRYIDTYSVEVQIPKELSAGEYNAVLSNGYGGSTACSMPIAVQIKETPVDTREVLNVLSFGADPLGDADSTAAFAAALDEAGKLGGAVVYAPRGRYWLTDALAIPDNTVLKGESKQRTQLYWTPFHWEYGKMPRALLSGNSNITIEDIDFRGTRVMRLFSIGVDIPDAQNIKLRRIRAFFNALAGHEYHITQPENRMDIYNEILKNGIHALVCIAGDNIQITESEFANTGMTFGDTDMKEKKNFLFRNNKIQERISGWAYFVHSDNSIIEDNEFEGCTLGFGGANAYVARNYIHDVLNNDREAFTTDMSYSIQSLNAVKIEGTKITFGDDVKLQQDRVVGYGGLYINHGKGKGQARRVVRFEGNVAEIDAPFVVEPDTASELTFGGTFRTAFYLVKNRCYNTGHIQFFVDQCSSVYDGNSMQCSAGIMVCSWQELHNPNFATGTLPLLTRTQTNFISMINNHLSDGNLFHLYGKRDNNHTDGWSGFCSIGCHINGLVPTNTGMLIHNNTLDDNAFINICGRAVKGYENSTEQDFEDAIIDGNTISNSNYGIDMGKNHASRLLISRNDFSNNVDVPLKIDWELNYGDILIAE